MGEMTVKKVLLVGVVALLFIWFGIGNFFNSILHTIKPTKFEVGNYEIQLQYKHWGHVKSDALAHHMVGKNGMHTLEVFKDPKNYPDIKNIFLDCYNLIDEKRDYQEISGRFIVCEAPMKFIVFFKSLDGDMFIRSELNELMTDAIKKEYDVFLNSIKKIRK